MLLLPLFFLVLATSGGSTSTVSNPNGNYIARYEVGGKEAAIRSLEAAGGTVVQHIEGVRVFVVRSLTSNFIASLANDGNLLVEENVERFVAKPSEATQNLSEAFENTSKAFRSLSKAFQTPSQNATSCSRTEKNLQPYYLSRLELSKNQKTPYGIGRVQGNLVKMNPKNPKKICLVGSGLDIKHPDICGRKDNCTSRITTTSTIGYNFNDPQWWLNNFYMDPLVDEDGYGTEIAGTIAAINNAMGVASVAGGSTNLHIVKVLDYEGVAVAVSVVLLAISTCINAKSDVILMGVSGFEPSAVEELVLQDAFDTQNVLLIASGGDFGTGLTAYPAAYPSVLSIRGVDKKGTLYRPNGEKVDLVAPAQDVLTTSFLQRGRNCVVRMGKHSIKCAAAQNFGPNVFTADTGLTANLVDCGFVSGNTTCLGARGKICLAQKAEGEFFDVVTTSCQKSGCVAVLHIARLDIAARFNGVFKIPTGMISICDHRKLRAMVDTSKGPKAPVKATLITVDSPSYRGYAYASGTDLAAAHVAGVAALIMSYAPPLTSFLTGGNFTSPAQIREALLNTAKDLGASRNVTGYGKGLVQAKAALEYLVNKGQAAV